MPQSIMVSQKQQQHQFVIVVVRKSTIGKERLFLVFRGGGVKTNKKYKNKQTIQNHKIKTKYNVFFCLKQSTNLRANLRFPINDKQTN
jgi:hypothetical protein